MNFLPGWEPGLLLAGGGLTTFELVASSDADGTTSITAPADIQAGDLLIIVQRASNSNASPPTAVTPSGFLTASNEAGTFFAKKYDFSTRVIVNYKVADGSEASGSFSIMNGSDVDIPLDEVATFLVFRGNVALSGVNLGDVEGGIFSPDTEEFIINASAGAPPLLVFAAFSSYSDLPDTDYLDPSETARHSNLAAGSQEIVACWMPQLTSGLDVTTPIIEGGDPNLVSAQSMYFELLT
jgi:hypothetical protein